MKALDKNTVIFYIVIVLIPVLMLGIWLISAARIRNAEAEMLQALEEVTGVLSEAAGSQGDTESSEKKENGVTPAGKDPAPENPVLKQKTDALGEIWDRHQKILVMFMNHDEINEIDFSVVQFRRAAEFGDYEAAVHNADRIRRLFEMLREHDEVSLRNIL